MNLAEQVLLDAVDKNGAPFSMLVFIGRFSPFHAGHAAILKQALSSAERVLVLIGSSRCSRSHKNPFSATERHTIIRMSLTQEENRRLIVDEVHDCHDSAQWFLSVQSLIATHGRGGAPVAVIGHKKDGSSEYLSGLPLPTLELPRMGAWDASMIRDLYFGKTEAQWREALESAVAGNVLDFLSGFARLPIYADLRAEWRQFDAERNSYASLPYRPCSFTSDAVVRQGGRFLMIRRSGAVGKGLWALPGGFVEAFENSFDAALRELIEETDIRLNGSPLCAVSMKSWLAKHLRADHLFESPVRSVRAARVLSRAYLFDLPAEVSVQMSKTDEASETAWFDLAEIKKMEPFIFEDHAHIVEMMTERLHPA